MKKYNKKSGYTLIELIVVAGLLAIISGFVATIMITSLRGGAKSKITNEVSQNGNFALSEITREIVKAKNVTFTGGGTCSTDNGSIPWDSNSGSSILLDQLDDADPDVTLTCDPGGRIIKNDGTDDFDLLDNSQVKQVSCEFVCSQEDIYSTPVIKVSFTITQFSTSNSSESIASAEFSTTAALRNYSPF